MSAQEEENNEHVLQARACRSPQDCLAMYDKWANSYDDDVEREAPGYVAPKLVTQVALKFMDPTAPVLVLDAGCGTGLVGRALASAGSVTIDGLDLSPAMLRMARETRVYRNLSQADLTQPVDIVDEAYDLIICVGTFTSGHVGPVPALKELVRMTRSNGIIAATVLKEIWLTEGFRAEVERLGNENVVTVVMEENIDYVTSRGETAVLVVLRKKPLK